MAEVIWLDSAQRDVRDIHAFIARDSPRRAEAVVQRLQASVKRLAAFPESGRLVPELRAAGYREIVVESYRVIYRYIPQDEIVAIVAVVHGRRLLPPIDGNQ